MGVLTRRCFRPAPDQVSLLLLLLTMTATPPAAAVSSGAARPPAAHASGIYRKGQTRIMPMGDSITNAAGWRIYLQDLLRQNGYTFRMVGGRSDPQPPEGYWPDHSGFGGWTIGSMPRSEEFGSGDADWIGQKPDLILLQLGTNDLQWGNAAGAPERLGGLMDKIWADVPGAIIIVGQITPFAPGARVNDKPDGDLLDPLTRAYNAAIPGVVAQKVAAGRRAAVVDLYSCLDPHTDLRDKCHPNESGNRKMAQRWFGAVQAMTLPGRDYPAQNLPPVLDASVGGGTTETIASGQTVQLTGNIVDDDRKPAACHVVWQKTSGPGTVTFTAAEQLKTGASFSASGSYCLSLVGSDGQLSAHANVRVVVTAPQREDHESTTRYTGRVISINIGGGLAKDERAGMVPRPGWNAVILDKSWPVTLKELMDDAGKPTGASYQIRGNNFVFERNEGEPDSADGRLLTGCYGGTNLTEQFVRGIPFAHYDLYLYFQHRAPTNPAEENFVHCFLLRDPNSPNWVAGPMYAKNMTGPFQKWVRASDMQVTDGKDATPAGNYLVIADLSLQDIDIVTGAPGDSWSQIEWGTNNGGAHSAVCGMQLVERNERVLSRTAPH